MKGLGLPLEFSFELYIYENGTTDLKGEVLTLETLLEGDIDDFNIDGRAIGLELPTIAGDFDLDPLDIFIFLRAALFSYILYG